MTREGNRLSWDIEGIELPPNVNAPEGEGFVTFTVGLKPGLPDGTVIRNKAEIIFDKNFPIETNVYTNTLDLTAPVTTMSEANYDTANELIAINCSSYDAASGVDSYQLFVSKDGGDYTCAGQFPDQVFYSVPAGDGATYSFYVLAIDRVGNAEVSRSPTASASFAPTIPHLSVASTPSTASIWVTTSAPSPPASTFKVVRN